MAKIEKDGVTMAKMLKLPMLPAKIQLKPVEAGVKTPAAAAVRKRVSSRDFLTRRAPMTPEAMAEKLGPAAEIQIQQIRNLEAYDETAKREIKVMQEELAELRKKYELECQKPKQAKEPWGRKSSTYYFTTIYLIHLFSLHY